MKILHITGNLGGGISGALQGLVESQNQIKNIEAQVLVVRSNFEEKNKLFFFNLPNDFSSYLKLYKPDIVIFHGFYFKEFLRLAKVISARQIPYLIEPHGSFSKTAMKKSWLKKKIANFLFFNHFLKGAAGSIFLTRGEQYNSVYEFSKSLLIPNGIDTSLNNLEGRSFLDNVDFYFLGRFDIHIKGLDILFDALDLLEHKQERIRVSIYGYGNQKDEEYVSHRISKYKYMEVVNRGKLTLDKMIPELSNKIMLITSRTEGFPMTILEAWSYGNPCLVTPGTNMFEETIKYDLGWGCEANAESIANEIKKAAVEYQKDPSYYQKRTREYVQEHYSLKNVAEISISKLSKFLETV